jgi:hypothetical protein
MLFRNLDWRLQLVLDDEDWAVRTFAAERIVAMASASISWLIRGGEERRSYLMAVRNVERMYEWSLP